MEKIRVTVTPHKISVFILIRIYGEVKLKYLNHKQSRPDPDPVDDSVTNDGDTAVCNPRFRRNFCMLMLSLIQGPDMSLTDLCTLLLSKEDVLFPEFYQTFHKHIRNIVRLDIEGILELVCRVNLLMSEPSPLMPIITKTSVLGLHIRRTVVLFERLSCSGVVEVFKAFKLYQLKAPKLDRPHPARPLLFSSPLPPEEYEAMVQAEPQDDHHEEIAAATKDSGALWTRRQAELFLAQQSAMIVKNEATAMSVEDLHNRVQELLNANPDCSEAYFLAYLNFLRVKDFCGALHSLYHCFDRGAGFHVDPKQSGNINNNNTPEDKARSFRYGALNLAMFYAHFGHKKEAMLALNECVMLAHGSSCNFCLQHALCWLYRLCDDNKEVLMERSIARSNEFNLSYLSSLGIQSLGQLSAFSNKKPCLIFEMLTKSDILNCQHSMLDLAANSYTLKSTLWSLYGRPAMSGLHAQLLLHSEAQDVNSEATCLALCQLASQLMAAGEPHMTASVLWHTRERFPQLASQHARVCCEQVLSFEHLMRQGLWQDARRAAEQLAATDQWESMLRLAELQLMQGDQEGALQRVNTLLEECRTTNSEVSPSVQVRAIVLSARVLGISSTVAGRLLVAALTMSESRYLTNLNTNITLKLAEHQLLLGLPAQALSLVNSVLLSVLSHGSVYEQGQALLLQTKCRISMLNLASSEQTDTTTASIINTLQSVRIKFEKSQAIADVREVSLLQAIVFHHFGMHKEKLKLALELRLLDEQIASRASSHV